MQDPAPEWLDALARIRARAKLRMGGVVAEAFPSQEGGRVHSAALWPERQLPFKATAGLHHPIRSRHPFTYAAVSASGTMHGFLNVLFAAALLYFGGAAGEALKTLEEERPRRMARDPGRHPLPRVRVDRGSTSRNARALLHSALDRVRSWNLSATWRHWDGSNKPEPDKLDRLRQLARRRFPARQPSIRRLHPRATPRASASPLATRSSICATIASEALLKDLPDAVVDACTASVLNPLMALGPDAWSALRRRLTELLCRNRLRIHAASQSRKCSFHNATP